MARPNSSAADPTWGPREDLDLLNHDLRRLDGPDKVTGKAVYTHDVRLPGMVWARVVRYPKARGVVRSIDVSAAGELPGVVAANALKEAGDDIAFSGTESIVAIVAGETPEAAMDAARAVVIDVEPLPAVVTTEDARKEDAPVIVRSRRRQPESNFTGLQERGDEEASLKGWEAAAGKVDITVEIPTQHHVCLETHGHVVQPGKDGGEAVVYSSTQNVHGMPGQFQGTLGDNHVVTQHMGGGFGAKFGAGVEGRLAAELAVELGRPVHLMLTRSDEFTMAGNRSGSKQRIRLGASEDGTLTAIHVDAEKHGGMGGGAFPGAPYRYQVGEYYYRAQSLHTAADANRAMRAPGHPQASFGMETAVDAVAYELGLDPLEVRKKNLASPVHHRQLDRVAREIGWLEHPNRTKPGTPENGIAVGIGFGAAGWGPGGRDAECDVTVHPDGRVVSATATQDLGTGARTYVAAIVADELGLPLDGVRAEIGDSRLPRNVASGGSVTTGSSAPAIKHAAHLAREALEAKLEPVLEAGVGEFTWKDGRVHVTRDAARSLSWTEVCALLKNPLRVTGEHQRSLYEGNIHGAQAAKVEVDTYTGRVRVLKMVAMQDQGLPLNRMALRSQINGGMIQALSYGLLEARIFDAEDGYLLSDNLDVYRIAGAQEMPEMLSIIDDEDERDSVCGMAEAPIIPGQSAIANAIYNACGARLTRMPFTPDNVLTAIHGEV